MSIVLALLWLLMGGAFAIALVALFDFSPAPNAKLKFVTPSRGILLGAIQTNPLQQCALVSLPFGHALLLGETAMSDDALLAAASSWDGALVFVDGRGTAGDLQRTDIIRFAPARPGSACYNPLQAIGAGPRAWVEALGQARALLGRDAEARSTTFAALMLDHLMTAPIEKRTLPALRARLQNPKQVLAELASVWTPDFAGDQAPHAELARTAAYLAHNPMKAAADIEHANRALRFIADGRFAASCGAHDFDLSDLIAGSGPTSLVLELPQGALGYAAPFIAGVLAQLVSACTSAPDADSVGRAKKRSLLLVIEAEAHSALEAFTGEALILPPHAGRFGLSTLTQSASIPRSVALGAFDAVVTFGPQSRDNAEAFSAQVGTRRIWRPGNPLERNAKWANVLRGEMIDTPIVKPRILEKLACNEALILMGAARRRAHAITLTAGQSTRASILPPEALAPPIPNWSQAPIERPPLLPPTKPLPAPATKPAASTSTKIRKALARKVAPAIAVVSAEEGKLL